MSKDSNVPDVSERSVEDEVLKIKKDDADVKGDVKDDVKGDVKVDIKSDTIDDMTGDVRGDLKGDVTDGVTDDVNSDVKDDIKGDVKGDDSKGTGSSQEATSGDNKIEEVDNPISTEVADAEPEQAANEEQSSWANFQSFGAPTNEVKGTASEAMVAKSGESLEENGAADSSNGHAGNEPTNSESVEQLNEHNSHPTTDNDKPMDHEVKVENERPSSKLFY